MSFKNLYRERIALQRTPYVEKVMLRGKNVALSTSAETVWTPGATYARLTAAVAMEVVSDSANDAAAGTGARTVYVEGLDNNGDVASETATLNGTTPVALSNTYKAVNKLYVVTAGSGLTNAGVVDVRTVSGSVIKRQLTAGPGHGLGQDACFIYTVPNKHVGLLKPIAWSATDATDGITVFLLTHDESGIIRCEGEDKAEITVTGATASNIGRGRLDFGEGILIPGNSLLELRCITDAAVGVFAALGELLVFDVANSGIL